MNFISTRDSNISYSLKSAIQKGLAEDGGLFVPEYFPKMNASEFSGDFVHLSEKILSLFSNEFEKNKLALLCKNAFNFELPLKSLNNNTFLLELFHGPTSSFKDFGARFLSEYLNAISENEKSTILVATSGDTGSAVASAFYGKPNINVIVLYPKGQISARQEHQITCWGTNILALAVEGNFDDCQALVKSAFQDPWWKEHTRLSSANSINIGRLLPQIIYYAYSSIQFLEHYRTKPGFVIPSGNLGNATAAYWAKAMGFPIREIALSSNANKVLPDYLQTGKYTPRPSLATLANAMDVGNPSNFERLHNLFPSKEIFNKNVRAQSISDEDIQKTIKNVYSKFKTIICPHTATAFFARENLSDEPWIVVATADPCKFENIIEPIIEEKVPVAPQLQALLEQPSKVKDVAASLDEIRQLMQAS